MCNGVGARNNRCMNAGKNFNCRLNVDEQCDFRPACRRSDVCGNQRGDNCNLMNELTFLKEQIQLLRKEVELLNSDRATNG